MTKGKRRQPYVLVTVNGGIAEVFKQSAGVGTLVFDLDNVKQESAEGAADMLQGLDDFLEKYGVTRQKDVAGLVRDVQEIVEWHRDHEAEDEDDMTKVQKQAMTVTKRA